MTQALLLAETLARGTPDARRIIGMVLENQVREMV